MLKPQLFQFEVTALEGAVDAGAGVIKGVSVITSGVQAKGHNLEVDEVTLAQMLNLGTKKGRVPVKWNHKSGADAVNGFFTNFRTEGHKLKADWHLLKSHSQYGHALELAERMPENVGFSASFIGLSELADGTKVFNPDEETKTHYTIRGGARYAVPANEKVFARCTDLISVDLVASPAANPDGMFEARVDSPAEGMAENATGDTPEKHDTVTLAAILDEVRQFSTRLTHLEEAAAGGEDDLDEADDIEGEEEEGEEGEEDEAEDAPDASEFRSLSDVIQYFENRLDNAASDRERREFAAAQDALEERVGSVLQINQQLLQENQILAEAFHELSAKTKSTVEFSAGADGTQRAVVRKTNGQPQTSFERRVSQLQAEGKDYGEALTFATGEDLDRYQTHLAEKGAVVNRL